MFIQSLYVTCLGIPLITRGYPELLTRAEIHQRGILYQILKVTVNSNSYLLYLTLKLHIDLGRKKMNTKGTRKKSKLEICEQKHNSKENTKCHKLLFM